MWISTGQVGGRKECSRQCLPNSFDYLIPILQRTCRICFTNTMLVYFFENQQFIKVVPFISPIYSLMISLVCFQSPPGSWEKLQGWKRGQWFWPLHTVEKRMRSCLLWEQRCGPGGKGRKDSWGMVMFCLGECCQCLLLEISLN